MIFLLRKHFTKNVPCTTNLSNKRQTKLLVCILAHHTYISRIGQAFVIYVTDPVLSDAAYPVCSMVVEPLATPADVAEVVVLLLVDQIT